MKEEKLLISVKDSGIGIPVESIETIFNPYQQGSLDIPNKYGGTGLGLSITKQLIELHGGSLWVKSKEGEGSEFFFTLPIIKDDKIRKSNDNVSVIEDSIQIIKNGSDSFFSQKRVLSNGNPVIIAVDDEPLNLEVIQTYLSDEEYLVYSISSGTDLINILSEIGPVDLVILDIYMPEISSYELCKEIRKKYYSYELPVLMLTASSNPEDLVQAFSNGASDYITKPVFRAEMLARVNTHIQLKNSIARVKLSGIKMNEMDRLLQFGFLASAFILKERISVGQENLLLQKAYEYYKPVLNEYLKDFSDINEYFKSEEENYDSITKTFNNLEPKELMRLLLEIKKTVQIPSNVNCSEEDLEKITSDVFNLVSKFLLIWNSKDDFDAENRQRFENEYNLTQKEVETAGLVYHDYSNPEIAEKMNISVSTVKKHI